MGCNICNFSNENLIEEDFNLPADQNDQNCQNDNIIIPSNSENKKEIKNNISSTNLKINKYIIQNDNKNIDNKINENRNNNNRDENVVKIINEKIIENKLEKFGNNNSIIKQNNELENKINESKNISSNKNDYNTRVIDLINEIRIDPQKYSDIIFNNLQYITKEIRIIANDETGQNEEKEEIFFQKKVKVKLYVGEKAFIEAANSLKNIKSMKELLLNDEIKLNMPDNEEDMNDNNFIKKQLIEIRKKNNINAFFKDSIKNPEIAVLLMIVGDYKDGQNKKRNAILNPEYKYIGINSKFIGNLFIAYYTFSK